MSEARPFDLKGLSARLQALQSAWSVLAPCCLPTSADSIAETLPAAGQELARLSELSEPDAGSLKAARDGLDRLASSICGVAFETPWAQFQANLPGVLSKQRPGLLALLDLLAGDAFDTPDSLAEKIGLVDYLITLLCTEGDREGRITPRDPVVLTPAIREICRRAEAEHHARLSEIEGEFFTGANVETDLRDELQQKHLRSRKSQLGRGYFAPGMLRAIVTYNVALLQCVAAEVVKAQSWLDTSEPAADVVVDTQPGTSVFESDSFRELHAAIRGRLAGRDRKTTAIDRLAWALDLDYLTIAQRAALREGSIAPSDVETVVIMVGMLCRSMNVLAIELQEIGIDLDVISEQWVREVDELLKGEVDQSFSGKSFKAAYGLSELRHKFLYAPMIDVQRAIRRSVPLVPAAQAAATAASTAATWAAEQRREARALRDEARALASEALAAASRPRTRRSNAAQSWREWPWRLIAPGAAIAVATLAIGLHQLGAIDLLQRDLERWSGKELASVSPHLIQGHRNRDGAGLAFVGTIDATWSELPATERERSAVKLVDGLRAQGIAQVMIYDADRQLRIQALGEKLTTL